MGDVAIRVEGLSKQYHIGRRRVRDRTLREAVAAALTAPFRRLGRVFGRHAGTEPAADQTVWALKDVSFDVKPGEVLAVVGSNGAGKTTLLKILSRITFPTTGYAEIHGRVGSLLEVGTGFHPELTGRENIYLNGAILGMKQAEIERKFDEIVDFSGVERFIDTAVKHFSSGMRMRLAFAVAAHLEPEILIVDEVLAVGDATFQKKCLGKMEGVAREGRTVLFVSHNLPAVSRLCPEAILLQEGRLVLRAPSPAVIERYMNSGEEKQAEKVWRVEELPNTCGPFRPIAVRVRNAAGTVTDQLLSTQPFSIEVEYLLAEPVRDVRVQINVYSPDGTHLFSSSDTDDPGHYERYLIRRPGRYASRCLIPANLLNTGVFVVGINVGVARLHRYFWAHDCVRLTVDATGGIGSRWAKVRGGFFRPAFDWEIARLE